MPKCPECERVVANDDKTCPYCAAAMPHTLPAEEPDLEARIRALLDEKEKIEAIKLYREETYARLADAKDAVEAVERGRSLPTPEVSGAAALESDVLRLLGEGRKIAAIKLYREQFGGGLKESKEAVEEIGRRHGLEVKGSGCLGVVFALLMLAFLK